MAERLPANALVVADPPWGKNYRSRHNSGYRPRRGSWDAAIRDDDFRPIAGDEKPFDPAPLLRFEKVVVFGSNYFAHLLPPSKCWLVWDKKLGKPDQGADAELAWTNLDKQTRVFHHLWRGIVRAGEANVTLGPKLHPNQKPVELLRRIILYADHQGPVIDAYCGSGSTACAAYDLGLECFSIDCELGWCEMTKRRVEMRPAPNPRLPGIELVPSTPRKSA